jgi:glyoxylase-like metal-dependent hydrolase (beta-lactamase superfamily II)
MINIDRRKFLTLSTLGAASLTICGKNLYAVIDENNTKKEIYHFNIGEFKCINFNTGYYEYPVSKFFDNIPTHQIQKELGLSKPPLTIKATFSCTYIDTGTNRILIDTGIGTGFEMPAPLQKYLQQEKISSESIDTIILSHAHADHISGLLDEKGNICFPNATYFSSKDEWNFYMDDIAFNNAKAKYPVFTLSSNGREVYDKIKNKLVFVQPETEIVPGIKVIDAKGHTPGQLAVVISSFNKKLIYIADVVFHHLHLKYPDWLPEKGSMFDQIEYEKTKSYIMNMAADENMLVSATHFYPPPGLGYIKKAGRGWEWIPIFKIQ